MNASLLLRLALLPSLLATLGLVSCKSPAKPAPVAKVAAPAVKGEVGIASIYLDHRTASGERYSSKAMAAAHKKLPLGCKVRVTNLYNGRSAIVRINDRGPYIRGRIIDLTPAAASAIGLNWRGGLAKVRVERL
jgi:rare lipoprotein A